MHRRSSRKGSFGTGLGIVLLFATGGTAALAQVDLSAWPKVSIELSLTDAKGNPLVMPPPAAFLLKEDGRSQPVVSLDPISQPQSVCVLIDTSGSMYERRDAVAASASRLISSLPSEDDVCVGTFAWQFRMEQPLTTDRAKALAAVKRSKISRGGTALYDAIAALAKYMHDSASSRSRVMLIFTDGSDNASAADQNALNQVRMQLEGDGSPVLHIVRVPIGSDSPSQDHHDRRVILSLTAIDAGQPYFPRDEKEMNADIDDLGQSMKARYILTYVTPNPAKAGRERQLEVAIDKAHGGNKLIVHAPEGYYAPSN